MIVIPMLKVNNIIMNTVVCLLVAFIPVGCLMEKEGLSADDRSVMIELSVSAQDMTKAQTQEDATDMEMVIKSLRVYAFYGENMVGYASGQATAIGEPFYIDLTLPERGIHNVDFYLVANEEEMAYENSLVQISERMTKNQLETLRFTGLAERSALPMYCKMTVPVDVDKVTTQEVISAGLEGHFLLAQKVVFPLSRSLAKLSVYAAKAQGTAATPQILSVDLLAAGTREFSYLFPQTDDVLKAVVARANNRTLLEQIVPVTKAVAKGTPAAEDPASYTPVVNGVYLPEVAEGIPYSQSFQWNVSSGDSREAVLNVRYTLDEGQDIRNGYIYLPRILRNNHIKICILINAEGQIIINYTVADWNWDESMMQDWFFFYPTHSYLWHAIPQTEEDLHIRPGKATMSENQPFVGYFQMTDPVSDKWLPTLEGLHAAHADIKVYNDRTNDLIFTSESPQPLDVSEDWCRIAVIPRSEYMEAGDVVNLAITYTPGGMTESEYMLINGSYPNYLWDASTSENYVTITMVN